MRKIVIAVLALLIIGGALYGAKTIIDNKQKPKPKVKKEVKIISTDTISNSTIAIVIPANGNLKAKRRVEIFSEVTGVFKSTGTLFKTGQEYRSGQSMILIENTEFYAQVQSARSNLKFRIRAPFNGILTEALVTEGTLVRNGQQLGEFIQTGVYELEVSISGEFADLLKIGKQVVLQNITDTKTYRGKVTRINGKINQETQTISTVIEVSHPDLKDGMYLTANLETQEIDKAIEINRSLLQSENQLFVVNNNVLKLTKVQPVHFSDKTVVVKGLTDGTVIISKMVPGAYEGMIVKTEEQVNIDKQKQTVLSTDSK